MGAEGPEPIGPANSDAMTIDAAGGSRQERTRSIKVSALFGKNDVVCTRDISGDPLRGKL